MLAVICLFTGIALGVILGRTGRFLWIVFLLGCSALIFAYCVWVPKTGQGFDDLGYAIIALLIVTPFALGVASGGALGWRLAVLRARKALTS